MATQAERDAQDVICQVVEIILANRELRPLIRKNPDALKVSAEMETRARAALRSACIRWFAGDTLSDLETRREERVADEMRRVLVG